MRIIDPRRSMMIILRHQTRKNFLPPDALFYTCSIASKRRLEISRACVCVCVQDDHLKCCEADHAHQDTIFCSWKCSSKNKMFSGKFSKPGQKFFLLTSYSNPLPFRLLTGCTWMTWRIADQLVCFSRISIYSDLKYDPPRRPREMRIIDPRRSMMIILTWHQTRKNFLPPDALFYTCSIASKRRLEISRACVCVCVQDDHLKCCEADHAHQDTIFAVENVHQKTKLFSGKFSKPGQKLFLLTSYSNPLPLDSWQVAHEWHGGSRISWFAFKEFQFIPTWNTIRHAGHAKWG